MVNSNPIPTTKQQLSRIRHRHLNCFLEVARTRQISAAALALNVSQPAASKTLRELEEILETKLFDRRGKSGLRLTPAGRIFQRYAGSSIAALKEGLNGLEQARQQSGPMLVVGALLGVAAQFMPQAVRDPAFMLKLQLHDPFLHAITRNTCSMTMLEGSDKINVVPPDASAELDCRLLPDQDPDAFIAQLSVIINDPAIDIEVIMGFTPAVSSTDTDLYRAIERVSVRHFPNSKVVPSVISGFTDSHFFRDMGIVAYGYEPIVLTPEETGRFHGNDERISVENVRRNVQMTLEVLQELVYE